MKSAQRHIHPGQKYGNAKAEILQQPHKSAEKRRIIVIIQRLEIIAEKIRHIKYKGRALHQYRHPALIKLGRQHIRALRGAYGREKGTHICV